MRVSLSLKFLSIRSAATLLSLFFASFIEGMPRRFVIGDIHGAYRALRQCLERSSFDFDNDHLIALGDVADGWPETRACIDKLLKIKNLTYIFGNHDTWALEWMQTGTKENVWLEQGGKATIRSYGRSAPPSHIKFFNNALLYYETDNKLFVHAGIDTTVPVSAQNTDTLLWDRAFAKKAVELHRRNSHHKLTPYDEVYIGHTPIRSGHPQQFCEVWMMDTGAGWSGVLSMMDIDSKEVFVSDPVPSLYPGVDGRKKR